MASRPKSRKKRVIWTVVAIVVAAVAVVGVMSKRRASGNGDLGPVVLCERGNIVEKALAVGSIVPRNEISVKSKVSGVVQRIFKEPGEKVRRGDPLLEIRPDPTPLELAGAKRAIEMDDIALRNAQKNIKRSGELLERGLISQAEYDRAEKEYEQAALQLKISSEHLALIEEGHINIAGKQIESIIKAPISGFILEKSVNIGDPVVPLTSYQEGTVLMTLADMDSLLFKGTVDEIDVGKLDLFMPVEIKIGALPDKKIPGVLDKISLKAQQENNSRMFPVEIRISDTKLAVLRAGYSANADIIINRAENVLTIPERVVYFSGDSTWVEMEGSDGTRQKVMIETGLSDAIRIEIRSGLEEGQEILEKPQKKI
jgi:HlyD family secretion protein